MTSRIHDQGKVEIKGHKLGIYIKIHYMFLAHPLNKVLADRWNRISVEVTPTTSPFMSRVEGSEKQLLLRDAWDWKGGWGYTG